jgi:hypothetical protein
MPVRLRWAIAVGVPLGALAGVRIEVSDKHRR